MNTISEIFPKTGRISGPEVGDGAKPDVPTTDRQNEKNKKFSKFSKFSSDAIASIFTSLPHWIQHTSIRDENRYIGKSGKPPVKTGRGLSKFRYVANLIYSSK